MNKMKNLIVKLMLLIVVVTMWTACSSDIVDGIQPTEQNKG